ncbi:MAG: acetyl-coenzyme A synthetase N-terminal domain-containing protein, partial [Bacteroidia bacterium]
MQSKADYEREYQRSIEDSIGFWKEKSTSLNWQQPFDRVLDWNFQEPSVRWFDGGLLNASENCLDRHLADRGDQIALIWEPNDPSNPTRSYTYQ